MRPFSVGRVVLVLLMSLFVKQAFAQAIMANIPNNNLEVSANGSVLAANGGHLFGWNATVTEYAFHSLPWLGITIDGAGYRESGGFSYTSGAISSNYSYDASLYTAMGGPTASIRKGRMRPFAHILFGSAIATSEASSKTTGLPVTLFPSGSIIISGSGSGNTFSMATGGGTDLRINSVVGIRAQGDWLRVGTNYTLNLFRGSAGVVFRF